MVEAKWKRHTFHPLTVLYTLLQVWHSSKHVMRCTGSLFSAEAFWKHRGSEGNGLSARATSVFLLYQSEACTVSPACFKGCFPSLKLVDTAFVGVFSECRASYLSPEEMFSPQTCHHKRLLSSLLLHDLSSRCLFRIHWPRISRCLCAMPSGVAALVKMRMTDWCVTVDSEVSAQPPLLSPQEWCHFNLVAVMCRSSIDFNSQTLMFTFRLSAMHHTNMANTAPRTEFIKFDFGIAFKNTFETFHLFSLFNPLPWV